MSVRIVYSTPLSICSYAIRTCWQSFNKSDIGGIKDKMLINHVGNKLKHSSTLEHLKICAHVTSDSLVKVFKEDPFSKVTGNSKNWVISTNVRALQNINLPKKDKLLFIPKDYLYLFYNQKE